MASNKHQGFQHAVCMYGECSLPYMTVHIHEPLPSSESFMSYRYIII